MRVKFLQYLRSLTAKGFSLKLKSKLRKLRYLIYGSKTWPMKAPHEVKLDRNERSTSWWMWGFTLKERKSGPALANRQPCSNCASESTSSPLPFLSGSPSLPLSSLPFPPRREAAPLKPARGSGEHGKLPSWVWGGVFRCIVCSQNAPGCSISGFLVSIAMSGKMKANPGSGRIWSKMALPPP